MFSLQVWGLLRVSEGPSMSGVLSVSRLDGRVWDRNTLGLLGLHQGSRRTRWMGTSTTYSPVTLRLVAVRGYRAFPFSLVPPAQAAPLAFQAEPRYGFIDLQTLI